MRVERIGETLASHTLREASARDSTLSAVCASLHEFQEKGCILGGRLSRNRNRRKIWYSCWFEIYSVFEMNRIVFLSFCPWQKYEWNTVYLE